MDEARGALAAERGRRRPTRCRDRRAHRAHRGLVRRSVPGRAVGQGQRRRDRGRDAFRGATVSWPTTSDRSCSSHLPPRGASLPDADCRSRADVGPALRRRARIERLGGDAGVARALQPVRGGARPQRRVVSLPPSLPGAAAVRAGASRAGARAAAARRAADWCEANGQPEAAIGYAQAGRRRRPGGAPGRAVRYPDLPERSRRDRRTLARLDRESTAHSSGTRRSPWSARLLAALWGRPAEAERWADAAERASYDGTLARRQRFDRLVAGAAACAAVSSRGGEDARRRGAGGRRRSRAGAGCGRAPCCCSRCRTGSPARSIEADDLFADAAEEGLELGAPRRRDASPWASAPRSRSSAGVGAGRGACRPGAPDHPRTRMEEYPTSAFVYAVAARIALHLGDAAAPRSCSPGPSVCGRGSPTRCRTSRSRPAWSSRGPT